MAVGLRYEGREYRLQDGHWRGPDGHVVHFLTWVTDDLGRSGRGAAAPRPDLVTARKVAARIGVPLAAVRVLAGPELEPE